MLRMLETSHEIVKLSHIAYGLAAALNHTNPAAAVTMNRSAERARDLAQSLAAGIFEGDEPNKPGTVNTLHGFVQGLVVRGNLLLTTSQQQYNYDAVRQTEELLQQLRVIGEMLPGQPTAPFGVGNPDVNE